jgi:hypothetical protein
VKLVSTADSKGPFSIDARNEEFSLTRVSCFNSFGQGLVIDREGEIICTLEFAIRSHLSGCQANTIK